MQKADQNYNHHIVFLGEAEFPYGLAAIQRMTLIAKAYLNCGVKTTVICRKGAWDKSERPNFGYKGNFDGIDYIYTSKTVYRPKKFINRNLEKLKGVCGEFKYLKYLKKHDRINFAIVSNMRAFHILRYLIYSFWLKFPVVMNFVEMSSAMQHRNGLLTRFNDYIVDKWLIKLFDGSLPISDKLMSYYKSIAPKKPSLKLPILCDFDKFNLKKTKVDPYFLYCGNIGYKEVINFIIEAYKNLSDNTHTKLFMIVSGGSKRETDFLQQELNAMFHSERVKLFSDIPYQQLVHLYTNALAMLIPLRPTLQDVARFPHKIGEYLASGNPIITTNVGEIKNYFEDGKTALIADSYSIDAFSEKMRFVLGQPEISKEIGLNGKQLGFKEFHYKTHSKRLLEFLNKLSIAK